MELTSPSVGTLKINCKKGYILIDPDSSEDAKVVILNDHVTQDIVQTENNLVIYGPGDFEASGILIKGVRPESETMYSIDTGEGRILIVCSTSVAKLSDEDEFDVVAVKAVGPVEESALSALTSKLVVVYGDEGNIPESLKAKKEPKINMKKRDEIEGNIVYLERK
ncbi:MAG: hypothetical protein Q7T54_04140 [Candidatus Levybacteria bacterium]|nr:hypothetical protein [Candidatus Levybacteria bacterium]